MPAVHAFNLSNAMMISQTVIEHGHTLKNPPLKLREQHRENGVKNILKPDPQGHQDDAISEPQRSLNCIHCQQVITNDSERIEKNASHSHRFTNPHGITFHIGCFASAPGVISIGETSTFWSWFAGYRWQIVLCRNCGVHFGWRFTNGAAFYGLILKHLTAHPQPRTS